MDSWEIWNRGVLLSRAHLRIASPAQAGQLAHYEKETSGSSMMERLLHNLESGVATERVFENVTGPISEKHAVERSLRATLLQYIGQGKLRAFGLAMPRKPEDTPIEVPPDLWTGIVAWQDNRLQANGLRIEQVKLIDAKVFEKHATERSTQISEEIEPLRSAGRPSRKDQIIEAFHALLNSGELNLGKPASHSYPAVKKWVQEHYPIDDDPERGLSDKALEKHFNPLFRERKNGPISW